MNYFLKNYIFDKQTLNSISSWIPSDTQERFKKNLKKYPKKIKDLGWTEDNIHYRFDKFGFRNDDNFRKNQVYNLVLGCSHTFGIGVRSEHIWFNYLKTKFVEPFYNASIPGGSIGGCVRSLIGLQQEGLNIKRVFILIPDRTRNEVFREDLDKWETVSWWTDHPKDLTGHLLAENTLRMFHQTNHLAIKQLCYQSNIELVDILVDNEDDVDQKIHNDGKARDLEHMGIDAHNWLGEKFYNEYCKRYQK